MFSAFCGEKSWPYVKSLETDAAWEWRIGDMRRVVVGFVTDAVDMAMHDGVSIIRIQERQEDRILMARSGRSWVLEMRSSGGRDDSLLCLLWHRHQSSSPPLPSSARLSSAWTQNYSLILRPDCLIAHWRFWRLVFCGSITVFSLFSPVSASTQCGLCDCWGDDRMPADCDDRSSSSDPHHL